MDKTREADLQQLNRMKEGARSTTEREKIDRVMSQVRDSSRDPRIAHAREELISAHRAGAVEDTHRIEERIREYERR